MKCRGRAISQGSRTRVLLENFCRINKGLRKKRELEELSLKLKGADCNGRVSNTERDKENTEKA